MKKFTIFAVVFFFAATAWAGSAVRIGNATFYHLDNGKTVTAQKIGSTTFYSGAVRGTSQTIGNTTFHRINGQSGISHRTGSITTHRIGDSTGITHQVGNTDFTSWNNGDTTTTQRVGNSLFFND